MDLQDIENLNSRSFSDNKTTKQTNNNSHQKPKAKTEKPVLKTRSELIKKAQKAELTQARNKAYKAGLEKAQIISDADTQGFLDGLAMASILKSQSEEIDSLLSVEVPKFQNGLDVAGAFLDIEAEQINPKDFITYSLSGSTDDEN
jgi:hypothetical protein